MPGVLLHWRLPYFCCSLVAGLSVLAAVCCDLLFGHMQLWQSRLAANNWQCGMSYLL